MIAVVVVCYNRTHGLKRLINSMLRANYYNDEVDLIISIDKGHNQSDIIEIAKSVSWNFGQKHIRAFDVRQGLRSHVLACGDLVQYYDAIIVLEDDLVVSKSFYSYCKQAVDFYGESNKIGGISLYKHLTHPGVNRPFEPENNGYDVFLMQYAQSWGQCWTRKMWNEFRLWYDNNDLLLNDGLIPEYVTKWNDKSWLKYYIRYIAEKDLYFVYPYISLSTNCSDVGEHSNQSNNDFQVSLLNGTMKYRFVDFNNCVCYDSFFEREDIINDINELFKKSFNIVCNKVCIDLYGIKTNYFDCDILITTSSKPYSIIKTFGLKYRPHEINCLELPDGTDVYIYDLHKTSKSPRVNNYNLIRFDIKSIGWRKTLFHGLHDLIRGIKLKIGSKFKV